MKARVQVVMVVMVVLLLALSAAGRQERSAWGVPAPPPHPGFVGRRQECPQPVCPEPSCPEPVCPQPVCPALPSLPPCPPPAPPPEIRACPSVSCPEPVCPQPACPACPGCLPANVSCPQPVCPPAVCPRPSCPPAPAQQCSANGAPCAGCLWKVLVTYDHFQGHGFYKAYKTKVDWYQAKALCAADGGHLAVINSDKEAAIFKLLYQKNELSGWIFIGFHDLKEEKHYETVMGEPLSKAGYMKWRPGQPDNAGNEDCGTIDENALLNDGRCDWKIGFICEVHENKALGQ